MLVSETPAALPYMPTSYYIPEWKGYRIRVSREMIQDMRWTRRADTGPRAGGKPA
jgi:hypothetical protein